MKNQKKCQTTITMKVSGEWMEQKNGVNSHRKYAIREFKCHLTSTVDVAVAFFLFCSVAVFIVWKQAPNQN